MGSIFLVWAMILCCGLAAQPLYVMPKNVQSRVSSFENPDGKKGNGATTNKGAKGNAFEVIQPGATKTLLNVQGQGTVQRIWLTIDQTPAKLRSLRLQMFWDGQSKPAVDVPMGDFFCYNLGRSIAFESALFSSGEGRSFNCYIPMPFKKAAKIILINEGKEAAKLFYDVDFVYETLPADALYFHAYWSRQMTGDVGTDFHPLPKVNGKGRFLGMSVGVNLDSTYAGSWWGEGEVKMFMDGDDQRPTVVGTGTEDYIGSAWGLGVFINQYQGCTLANYGGRQFTFYRFHIPDAIYFNTDLRVDLQQVGGWGKAQVLELMNKGVKLKPISVDASSGFVRLLDNPVANIEKIPDGWVNFYRVDDYSAVSYFYLDKPTSSLPPLAAVEERLKNVR